MQSLFVIDSRVNVVYITLGKRSIFSHLSGELTAVQLTYVTPSRAVKPFA